MGGFIKVRPSFARPFGEVAGATLSAMEATAIGPSIAGNGVYSFASKMRMSVLPINGSVPSAFACGARVPAADGVALMQRGRN